MDFRENMSAFQGIQPEHEESGLFVLFLPVFHCSNVLSTKFRPVHETTPHSPSPINPARRETARPPAVRRAPDLKASHSGETSC